MNIKTAKFIAISAKLNIGKFMGTTSIKSTTDPSLHLSIPLPRQPPNSKPKEHPSRIENSALFMIYIVSSIDTNRLRIPKKKV